MNNDKVLFRLKKNTIFSGECWLYLLGGMRGYGRISIDNKVYLTHRVSAYLFHGLQLDSVIQVNHKPICEHKSCWNPDHIYLGNQIDNMKDERGKLKQEVCIYGHPLDGRIYLRKQNKSRRYCRTCHNEQSKRSEKNQRKARKVG